MANLLNSPNPPTALMCCNDVAAIGAMKTLSGRGLQAGRDIALIGFDDLTICRFTQPPLTTIRFSPGELAALAFDGLLQEIQGSEKQIYEYKTRFIVRESTCPPNLEPSADEKCRAASPDIGSIQIVYVPPNAIDRKT